MARALREAVWPMTRRLRNKRRAIGKVALAACAILFVSLGAAQAQTQTATTTTLTSGPNASVFGQTVTVIATVSPVTGTGTPTGTVTFVFDGVATTVPMSLGQGVFDISELAVGSHPITATYNGDANFAGSASQTHTQVVNKADTTTTVATSGSPSTSGQPVTFTATVSVKAPGATTQFTSVTGMVTFFDGNGTIKLGTGTIDSGGQATFSTAALAVGTHTVTASYSGDSNFNGSTSATLTQTVNGTASPPSLSKLFSPSSINVGQTTSLSFTISNPNASPLTGVGFIDSFPSGLAVATPSGVNGDCGSLTITGGNGGGVSLSGATLTGNSSCTFSVNVTANSAGSLTNITGAVTSNESGPGNTATAKLTVNAAGTTPTTTAVTVSPTNPVFGQPITVTVAVSGNGGTPAGTVNLIVDGTALNSMSLSNGRASFTSQPGDVTVGSHTVAASYGGDSTFAASNGSFANNPVVVSKANTTTALTSSNSPSASGQPVNFTATVSPVSASAVTPTGGQVTFKDGSNTLGTVAVDSNGKASFSTTTLTVGSHTITASYASDPNFNGSTSANLTQTVNGTATTTTLNITPDPRFFGQSVTTTVTVAPVSPATGTPTGMVQITRDGAVVFTGTLSGGQITINGPGNPLPSVGTHSVVANYLGDTTFAASSSAPFTTHVNPDATTTAVTASAGSIVFGQPINFTATVSNTSTSSVPTGSVQFVIDGANFGAPVALANGTATSATTTTLSAAGSPHTVTANYVNADGNFSNSSGSLAGGQTVTKANTTTALTSSAGQSAFGQSVTFTATVAPVAPGAGTPTGTVNFTVDGGTPTSAPLNNGQATFSTSSLAVGSHTIAASYAGDNNFNVSSAPSPLSHL